ncbi:MAG: chemotaxis protein CheR [Tistrella sp.]|jgi:chemotaxis protein methyltransferase CheR|uniref:protein-glutamate O-methyltransferase n=1 Tax=Tistrella mobilis TaxID=171437 RepID=A0A3B9IM54_9PROT|nr:protein-glutamate O-methyltransferase [Tistrella sp.]MAD40105.1 chemotaxis protein CheR [Tistrella sp.]MBA77292.1 chemotaxis protein CheR [Tistrella sp.]HAE48778.1 chemotaxis protein CheR [Tistrella mobilis]
MAPEDFAFISGMLKQRSGLVIGPDKLYLLESRLSPLARRRGLPGLSELIAELRKPSAEELRRDVTDAMTTNETSFFRDIKPFEELRTFVLPEMLGRRQDRRQLRIWSAAASTGQEAYTIAMLFKEMGAKLDGWRLEIIGTDLANEVLDKAKAATYSQFEVQRGLPITMLVKYFQQDGEQWRLNQTIRSMVQFRQHNLLNGAAGFGTFDVIFCRNVLIYFDQDTKRKVLEDLRKVIAPDGFLFLGGAETVLGITDRFRPLPDHRGVYVPA